MAASKDAAFLLDRGNGWLRIENGKLGDPNQSNIPNCIIHN
ncbi:hypothetical protein [Brumimicrobium salinarum]|nr:hypothetical protein [Brumimicrobium salinarum]